MGKGILIIHTDGGSRGNPGPAACAFVAEIEDDEVGSGSKFLGEATNNVAEYEGVILALNWLLNVFDKKSKVLFLLDSELVVKQLNGEYKIKKPELQVLNTDIKKLVNSYSNSILFRNVPREQNKIADLLLNNELDRH